MMMMIFPHLLHFPIFVSIHTLGGSDVPVVGDSAQNMSPLYAGTFRLALVLHILFYIAVQLKNGVVVVVQSAHSGKVGRKA